ncbi:DUF4271 domain-containing protein [Zunongwangia sp. F363]|uniref:DUF4271 domain-containing protein n=1 Tax=Autumnicola tepida TaxID=3075595 RepID=A0ABU3CBM0_9FLAO|nr:DUF4271 domain-containing protein [Zunongwangia sp. F363]MDT0643435.1 DUF4271 domain-containing protein [Zunongwangia sp. F363]
MQALERQVGSTDWITIILVACIVLLAIIRNRYPQRFGEFLSLLTSNKFMMFRGKENNAFHPFNILLFLVNVAGVSLFLLIIYNFFAGEPQDLSPAILYVRIATGYTCFVLLKFGIEKIIANIFGLDQQIDEYLFKKLSYRNFLALFVLIVVVFLTYAVSPTRNILYGLLLFLLLSNGLSLVMVIKQNQRLISQQLFYFILYLCALEFAPYIILYKVFTINRG